MNMTRNNTLKLIPRAKSGIHIKKSHRGLFTKYCNGKVTNECIQRGKNSPDPKIRKRATFAANARKFKHQYGGPIGGGPNFDPDIFNKYNNNINAWKSSQAQQLETQRKLLDNNNKWASFGSNIAQNVFDLGLSLKQTLGALKAERDENNELTEIANALKLGNDTNLALKVRDGYITHKQAYEIVNPGGTDLQFDNNGMLIQNGMSESNDVLQKSTKAFDERLKVSGRIRAYNGFIKDNGYNITEGIKATKKGGLIKKTHRPFGHISVLDDTGKVDPKTLKLKKNYGRSI